MREANMAASRCSRRFSVASFGPLLILMVLGTPDAREGEEVVDEVLVRNVKTERDRALNNFFSSSLSGLATGGA